MRLGEWRRYYSEGKVVREGEEYGFGGGIRSRPSGAVYGPGPWRVTSPEVAAGLTGGGYVETNDARKLYHNVPVARRIDNGQPSALARWMDALDLQAGERVFHLGCGVGYYTAILADVVGGDGRVLSSEVDPAPISQTNPPHRMKMEKVVLFAGRGSSSRLSPPRHFG